MVDEYVPPPSDSDAPPGADVVPIRAPMNGANGHARNPRVLPHNLEAEASVLGGIILRNTLLAQLDTLEVDDFYDPRHKQVFGAMRNIEARNEPIDPVTLEAELEKKGVLDAVGGVAMIGQLALRVPTPDNVLHYARLVQHAHVKRRVLLHVDGYLSEARRSDFDVKEIVGEIVGGLERILGESNVDIGEPGTWAHAYALAFKDVRSGISSTRTATREPLFGTDAVDLLGRDFDETPWLVTGIATRGGILMIGAEPKTTKTWLGTEISLAVATGTRVCGEFFAQAGTVAYFYAEDLDRQIRNRIRALMAGAGRTLERGRFHACPRGKFLDITRDEDLAWVVASARQLGTLDLLFLDPLRDISSAAEDKSDEMGPVMKRLHLLGELVGCTVGVVHHAAKSTQDTAKRRAGQKLRGSGAIHGALNSLIYLSDTESEEPNVFKNSMEVELKGARGAGDADLTLSVEDDAEGEAISATWSVVRASKKAKRDAAASKKEEKLRSEIVSVVRSAADGFKSKNAIAAAIGGNRQAVLVLVGEMMERELAYKDGRIVLNTGAP